MAADKIVFEDGDAYAPTMGVWSGLAGYRFLDWLAAGLESVETTEIVVERTSYPAWANAIEG